jgi:hypothetical protein
LGKRVIGKRIGKMEEIKYEIRGTKYGINSEAKYRMMNVE